MSRRILVVEDNRSLGLALASAAERMNLEPVLVGSLAHAREELERTSFDGMLLDLGLPDGKGLELLEGWNEGRLPLVAVVTAHGEIENAIAARKLGVVKFLTKPVAFDELEEFLSEVGQEEAASEGETGTTALVGAAPVMQAVFRKTAHACLSRDPLVIRGARGTGRTHVARLVGQQRGGIVKWLYAQSDRDERVLGEVFGQADTVIIEDVVSLADSAQGELIRLLSEENRSREPRVIVTTGETGLRDAVDQGSLREELYYRLQVLEIRLPSLLERLSDLPALASHFLGHLDTGGRLKLSEEVLVQLAEHDWPGNLRELRNVVSFCTSARGQAGVVRTDDLPEYLRRDGISVNQSQSPLAECLSSWVEGLALEELTYQEIQGQVEGVLLDELLKRFEGKPSRMARELGLNRSTLRKRLRELPRPK